ncbi:uncharacterized protein FIBRA_00297 [Fibroporia radiculosa]|uniref:Pentacotripeptide-repeat region of PRORP domain-containing protein n=1 Tax=Fibroporia radiculosa TaxID=599839 RepID=J7SCP7_9APHY|nr:uncharacterized protein FIBRA_00297 [Fibroporia radiculosa]CCL98303.1 predicted protein [Fibroporia radiculosa]
MIRHATRGATATLDLDFLASRIVPWRSFSQRSSTPLKLKVLADDDQVVPSLPSTSSSAVDPARLISKLDLQLQQFHGVRVGKLTDSQVELFNRAILSLRAATQPADLRKAWTVWGELKKRRMLQFFGPSQYNMCSRIILAVCEDADARDTWEQLDRNAVEEIAVGAAAGGSTDGLKAYMLSSIRRNDPAIVHKLYERYRAVLGEKVSWRDVDDMEADEGGSFNASDSFRFSAETLVRGDILLAEVTAHAMQNDFAAAFRSCLQTSIRLSPHGVKGFLEQLNSDDLRQKVAEYVRRLEVARLVARPAAFSRQLANLTRDNASLLLEKLYAAIIEGLLGHDPWLTVANTDIGRGSLIPIPEFAWASFITGFMRCRRTDLAEKLWDDMVRFGVQPTVAMWTALIDGYGELKAVKQVLSTWDIMCQQGITPDAMAYRALIHGLYHANHPQDAFREFRLFQSKVSKSPLSFQESAVRVVYNTVLHGLLFQSLEPEANAVLDNMQAKGPKPDIVTFNTFLRYYARQNQLKAFANVLDTIERTGLVGDVFTFSIVLSALLKIRDDAPQIMLNLMAKHGVQPNATTLTAIIDHQMRTQTDDGLRSALQLLTKMELNEVPDAQPNDITYTSILSGIHRGKWLRREAAEEYRRLIWGRMRARDITPKRTTYNILIKACLENSQPEGVLDAMRYYRDMVRRRISMSNDTWYIILHALVSRGEWALANELVEDIQRSGFTPAGALLDLMMRVRKHMAQKAKLGPAGYI